MNKPTNYTPVGFKTKAVIEAQVKAQTEAVITTNKKIEVVHTMQMMGNLICSPKFQDYSINERVEILNEFAELKNIIKTFK